MGYADSLINHGMKSMGTLINFNATSVFTQSTSTSGGTSTTTQVSATTASLDIVQFGSGALSNAESMNIVLERAMEKLRAVVGEARAELGIPEDALLDTSPEATAERILEFALSSFDLYYDNHPELGEDEARQQFADFIGGAIMQGIQEASDILISLEALTPGVDSMIETITGIIEGGLAAFAAGK